MSTEEYLNAEGVTALSKNIFKALMGSSAQYWLNWFPEAEEDPENSSYLRIYIRPYIGEIDPLVESPTQWQFEEARKICNEADLIQGLGLLSFFDWEGADHYYVRVAAPLVTSNEASFTYDPVHGRFYVLSLYDAGEMDILEMALIVMFLLPKIIVTVFSKEIIGTKLPLYPAILPDWMQEDEEEEE